MITKFKVESPDGEWEVKIGEKQTHGRSTGHFFHLIDLKSHVEYSCGNKIIDDVFWFKNSKYFLAVTDTSGDIELGSGLRIYSVPDLNDIKPFLTGKDVYLAPMGYRIVEIHEEMKTLRVVYLQTRKEKILSLEPLIKQHGSQMFEESRDE